MKNVFCGFLKFRCMSCRTGPGTGGIRKYSIEKWLPYLGLDATQDFEPLRVFENHRTFFSVIVSFPLVAKWQLTP